MLARQATHIPSAQTDDDGNEITGAVVIVTEFLDGGNLREMWQAREAAGKTLRWDTVTGIFMEIAHALHYLHENGIVHRDIKPDNVLLDQALRCKLCDFGLARYGDSLTDNDALPMTICGTDEFMAPEVIFGEPYDCRADVYSFGILMTEVLCKRCVVVVRACVRATARPAGQPTRLFACLSGVCPFIVARFAD